MELVGLHEVKTRVLKCGGFVSEVLNHKVYVFDGEARSLIIDVDLGGLEAWEALGGSFRKIEDARSIINALGSMGFKYDALPDDLKRELAIRSVLNE
jgi:hypothetical protein